MNPDPLTPAASSRQPATLAGSLRRLSTAVSTQGQMLRPHLPMIALNVARTSMVAMAFVVLLSHWFEPARYPLEAQIAIYLSACIAVPLLTRLAAQVTSMRTQLRSQRAELHTAWAQLHEQATRDQLTRLPNRRHLAELMGMEQRKHQRTGQPLCLALIDLDGFKRINDTQGHAAGDMVLQYFSRTAQEVLRSTDLIGRWGGEEFLVMFPGTPHDLACLGLQRLQEHLAGAELSHIAAGLYLSFSAGLVQVWPYENLEASIERADQAMRRAKIAGRKRVVVDPPGAPADAVGTLSQSAADATQAA